MFIYYFVHLSRPFADVERALFGVLAGLGGWATAAYREGEEIRAKLAVGGERSLIAKTVHVEVGAPVRSDAEATIPITWEATGTPGLFPKMEADLVVANLGAELTQLALRGTYKPPLGAIGRALDRTLLHRLAEASVKGFVDRIARALEQDGPSESFSHAPEGVATAG